jgi:phosphoadenosine phosphosulfate reductase
LPETEAEALAEAANLDALYGHLPAQEIIARAVRDRFVGKIAAVSSFGADSAALLHMIAEIDRDLPIIFLDTGKHFEETLQYRDALVADFGLSNVQVVEPEEAALERFDPKGILPPGGNASRPRRALRCRPSSRSARASASIRWRAGRHRIRPTTCASTRCAPIRWSRTATCRSAAFLAPSRCRTATMRAAGAGLVMPRWNAVFTSPVSITR